MRRLLLLANHMRAVFASTDRVVKPRPIEHCCSGGDIAEEGRPDFNVPDTLPVPLPVCKFQPNLV